MADFIQKFSLFGIPAAAFVALLVQFVKAMAPTIPDRLMPFVVLGCSVVTSALIAVINLIPGAEVWVQYGVLPVLLTLMAMGAYSGVKAVAGK